MQDHFEFSRRSIQMLMWWISHQTLTSVALLILRTWFHIERLLIPLLIHSWISLLRTFFPRAPITSTSSKTTYAEKNIGSILDDQIVSARDGRTQRYLIKGRPDLEIFWITEDFRQFNPDLLEHYHNQQQLPTTHSTGLSSSHPRGIN